MLLRHALKLETEASAVEKAIEQTLSSGMGTLDISERAAHTTEMTAMIESALRL